MSVPRLATPSPTGAHLCLFCGRDAEKWVVWKYGVNSTCYKGGCIAITKGMVGFVGIYSTKVAARSRLKAVEIEKEQKRTHGKGHMVRKGSGVRPQDHA